MWIFTSTGFLSAVCKPDRPDQLTVRSRDKKSLEPLAEFAGVEIAISPYGDYPYRAFVEPAVFTEWVTDQASDIEYDNFKNQVAKTRGCEYTHALHEVWDAMHKTEDKTRAELIKIKGDN
jgi:predicted lipoprotein